MKSKEHVLSRQDITGYAKAFDPQPYHLDEAAAQASIFGGLCASGWQVAALGTRLIGEALLTADIAFVDITRVDELRWKRPSFVDTALAARIEQYKLTSGSAIPCCDTAHLSVTLINHEDQVVAELQCQVAIDQRGMVGLAQERSS